MQALENQAKQALENDELKSAAPGAFLKLREKNMQFDKITIMNLRVVAYEYYNEVIPIGLKPPIVKQLEQLYASKPERLDNVTLVTI